MSEEEEDQAAGQDPPSEKEGEGDQAEGQRTPPGLEGGEQAEGLNSPPREAMFEEEGDGQAEGQSTSTSEDQSPPPTETASGSSEGEANEVNSEGAQSLPKLGNIPKPSGMKYRFSRKNSEKGDVWGLVNPQTPEKTPSKNEAAPRSKSRTRQGKN